MFDVKKHLIKVNGGRQYLPVSARLVWFREEHPDWGIETKAIVIDTDKQYAIFEATVFDETGKLMAKGTKMEDFRGFPDYIEKSETGAIGRALAVCGFGTQFAPDLDEMDGERYVDTPQRIHSGSNGTDGGQGSGYSSSRYASGGGQRMPTPAPSYRAQPASTPTPRAESAEHGTAADSTVTDDTQHACSACGRELNASQKALSLRKYGIALCPQCQKERQTAEAAG